MEEDFVTPGSEGAPGAVAIEGADFAWNDDDAPTLAGIAASGTPWFCISSRKSVPRMWIFVRVLSQPAREPRSTRAAAGMSTPGP